MSLKPTLAIKMKSASCSVRIYSTVPSEKQAEWIPEQTRPENTP